MCLASLLTILCGGGLLASPAQAGVVNGTLLTSSGLARLEAMVERELKSAGR
jgi:hypothetical protein